MSESTSVKPPVWFWIVSVLALLWNIMGAMNYLGTVKMSEEVKAQLTADQLALIESSPAWVTAAFALAVWAGVLGCIALLLRKKWAKPVLLLSLLGIVVQMAHSFFMTNAAEVFGTFSGVVMPIVVIVIGVALVGFARKGISKGWLK